MNMGYAYDTARIRTLNLFSPECAPISIGCLDSLSSKTVWRDWPIGWGKHTVCHGPTVDCLRSRIHGGLTSIKELRWTGFRPRTYGQNCRGPTEWLPSVTDPRRTAFGHGPTVDCLWSRTHGGLPSVAPSRTHGGLPSVTPSRTHGGLPSVTNPRMTAFGHGPTVNCLRSHRHGPTEDCLRSRTHGWLPSVTDPRWTAFGHTVTDPWRTLPSVTDPRWTAFGHTVTDPRRTAFGHTVTHPRRTAFGHTVTDSRRTAKFYFRAEWDFHLGHDSIWI